MKKLILAVFAATMAFQVPAQMKVEKTSDGLLITEKGKKVLFYRTKPKNLAGKFERCNYIHPLWGLDGFILTEDFPADHLHHRGIFWTWHQVWIGDQRIGDPWEIKDFSQEVVKADFLPANGKTGILKTEVLWESPLWKKDGQVKPYMRENAEITIHPVQGNSRRIDFTISLLALENNLTIGGSQDDKGYSGFSVRMKLPEDVNFTGRNGEVTPKNEAVTADGYIDISGSLAGGGGKAGICILDNPGNPGYPQKWILRAKNSMQNAAWPGNTTVPVPTDKPLRFKYSLIIYLGSLDTKDLQF
jgi:hypothetical protein